MVATRDTSLQTSPPETTNASTAVRSRRVCVVRYGYFPQDPRVRKAVSALVEEGHSVDVICLRNEDEARRGYWKGARILRLGRPHRRGAYLRYIAAYVGFTLRTFVVLSARSLRRRYSLVQVHTMPDFLVFSAVVARLRGARVLLDFHEMMPELLAVKLGVPHSSPAVRVARAVEWLAARFAHVALAVNPLHAEAVQARTRRRCVVIPNVPDPDVFPTTQPTADPAAPEQPEAPVLITHGTLVETYGVQLLIRAVTQVLEKRPVKLWVVGTGEYLPNLQALAKELQVEEAVTFFGRVPFDEVPGYIEKADVGVFSLPKDGFMDLALPNKLFEYMAMGLPVVAPDLRGIRTCFDERHLTFFDPGDSADLAAKLVGLLDDPGRQTSCVAEALKVYRSLEWGQTKVLYLDTVRKLLTDASAAR